MTQLTNRQREVLFFIQSRIEAENTPPTIREIAAHFGIASTNGVMSHLRALERKGYVSWRRFVPRSLCINIAIE